MAQPLPPPPPPYAYVRVPTQPRTNGFAIASLVLGIIWLGGLGSILAIIFGGVAISQINRSHGLETVKGMAIAGLVLGIVLLVGSLLFLIPAP